MKSAFLTLSALVATLAMADIVIKPDGTVTCTGQCSGTISGSSIIICQGNTCVTVSSGTSGPEGKQHK